MNSVPGDPSSLHPTPNRSRVVANRRPSRPRPTPPGAIRATRSSSSRGSAHPRAVDRGPRPPGPGGARPEREDAAGRVRACRRADTRPATRACAIAGHPQGRSRRYGGGRPLFPRIPHTDGPPLRRPEHGLAVPLPLPGDRREHVPVLPAPTSGGPGPFPGTSSCRLLPRHRQNVHACCLHVHFVLGPVRRGQVDGRRSGPSGGRAGRDRGQARPGRRRPGDGDRVRPPGRRGRRPRPADRSHPDRRLHDGRHVLLPPELEGGGHRDGQYLPGILLLPVLRPRQSVHPGPVARPARGGRQQQDALPPRPRRRLQFRQRRHPGRPVSHRCRTARTVRPDRLPGDDRLSIRHDPHPLYPRAPPRDGRRPPRGSPRAPASRPRPHRRGSGTSRTAAGSAGPRSVGSTSTRSPTSSRPTSATTSCKARPRSPSGSGRASKEE